MNIGYRRFRKRYFPAAPERTVEKAILGAYDLWAHEGLDYDWFDMRVTRLSETEERKEVEKIVYVGKPHDSFKNDFHDFWYQEEDLFMELIPFPHIDGRRLTGNNYDYTPMDANLLETKNNWAMKNIMQERDWYNQFKPLLDEEFSRIEAFRPRALKSPIMTATWAWIEYKDFLVRCQVQKDLPNPLMNWSFALDIPIIFNILYQIVLERAKEDPMVLFHNDMEAMQAREMLSKKYLESYRRRFKEEVWTEDGHLIRPRIDTILWKNKDLDTQRCHME